MAKPRTNQDRDQWIDSDPSGHLPYLLAQSGLSRPDFIRANQAMIDAYIDSALNSDSVPSWKGLAA